jgi:DNA-binding NarL/FixJ family response regulator
MISNNNDKKGHAPLRVFIADDHPLMRLGLRLSLEQTPGIEVIGDANDGYSAVEKILANPPDVTLMDVDMPGLSGIGAIRMLRKNLPDMVIIVLSTYNDDNFINQAMNAGANGYVLKGISSDELANIILTMGDGKQMISPYLVNLTIDQDSQQKVKSNEQANLLTMREKELLQYLVGGKRSKDIANTLFISTETVKSHIKSIYRKLEVTNRVEALTIAKQKKIID